jgi:hypothetical protein
MRARQADVARKKYKYLSRHTLQYLVNRRWLSSPMILNNEVNPRIPLAEPKNRKHSVVCTPACDYYDVSNLSVRRQCLAFDVIQQVINVVAVIVAGYSDRDFRFFLPSSLPVQGSIGSHA